MNNKSYFLQCICAIIFLSIFSSCNSNSDKVKEMEKIIISAHTKINNLDFRDSIPYHFTYSAIHRTEPLHKFLGQVTEICHLDSISYIGHNWFQVSYDCCDSECPKVYYWKMAKEGNKYKLARHAKSYLGCTAAIKNLSYADRIRFWFNSKKYDYVEDYFYVNGSLCKVKNNGKYGLINLEGEEIVPCKYDYIYSSIKDLFKVKLNNKYGYINSKGERIGPLYDEHKFHCSVKLHKAVTFPWYDDNLTELYKVKLDNKYGIIYEGGKELVPCKYNDIEELKDYKGRILYRVELTTESRDTICSRGGTTYYTRIKYGIINSEGKEILPCLFHYINFAGNGKMLEVQRKNLWSYYTIGGTQLTDFYEDIKYYTIRNSKLYSDNMEHYIFAAKSNDKWGYINESGDTLIEFILDDARQVRYYEGTAEVTYNGRDVLIDLCTGKILCNIGYINSQNNYNNTISQKICPECSGTGKMAVRGGGIVIGTQGCPVCGGNGYILVPSLGW